MSDSTAFAHENSYDRHSLERYVEASTIIAIITTFIIGQVITTARNRSTVTLHWNTTVRLFFE
jgi:hypothetical protein